MLFRKKKRELLTMNYDLGFAIAQTRVEAAL
jgi:hypothetical protein